MVRPSPPSLEARAVPVRSITAPSAIANWTFELAKDFARFYDRCPVLGADDPAVRDARVKLCDAVATGIKSGLGLLGIAAPDRM
jgi:arginyl-tRNA synthetase